MKEAILSECHARLEEGILRVGNKGIERVWDLRQGAPVALSVLDRARGREWVAPAPLRDALRRNDAGLHGCPQATLAVSALENGPSAPHLAAVVCLEYPGLQLVWTHRVWPGLPVVLSELRVRGGPEVTAGSPERFHDEGFRHVHPADDRLDYFGLSPQHMRYDLTRFQAQSDHCDNLVQEERGRTYPKEHVKLRGHLLHLRDIGFPGGLVAIKLGPPWKEHLQYPGHDFVCSGQTLAITGWGVTPGEMRDGREYSAYSSVVGTTDGEDAAGVELFYRLDRMRVPPRPARDFGVLSNTWGDGNGSKMVNEAMVLREIRAAARLGVSRCQVDAGWQQGNFSDLGVEENQPKGPYGIDPAFWAVHTGKFPRGFAPVTALARKLGIRLGIWFNPSAPHDYAEWEKDAATVVALCREHGFDAVKIDGVSVLTKLGEERYIRFLERVHDETGGRVCINFDITGGRSWRLGHFHRADLTGNLFIENRYALDRSYYPFRTLRNLWRLANYIPSYRLQMEFVNTRTMQERYAGDPLAPDTFGTEYSCACVLFSNPLCWMEMQRLEPSDQRKLRRLLRAYLPHQEKILCGRVYPIGEEPDGRAWTGFQSVTEPGKGYLLFFREATDRPQGAFRLRDVRPGGALQLTPLAGASRKRNLTVRPDGTVRVGLPQPRRYALFQYAANGSPT